MSILMIALQEWEVIIWIIRVVLERVKCKNFEIFIFKEWEINLLLARNRDLNSIPFNKLKLMFLVRDRIQLN